jgi:hypothetical protein
MMHYLRNVVATEWPKMKRSIEGIQCEMGKVNENIRKTCKGEIEETVSKKMGKIEESIKNVTASEIRSEMREAMSKEMGKIENNIERLTQSQNILQTILKEVKRPTTEQEKTFQEKIAQQTTEMGEKERILNEYKRKLPKLKKKKRRRTKS